MKDRVRVVFYDIPEDTDGFTVEGLDDNGEPFYTICLNSKKTAECQLEAFRHETEHIYEKDFDKAKVSDVNEIENYRHGRFGTV